MILITGAKGQLGHDLQKILRERNEPFLATDFQELDITDIEAVRAFAAIKGINCVINCAAYNNVDKAEEERELCRKLNAIAPRDLALVAKELGADYVTYSTDFVFDGKKGAPYTEEDAPNPLSVYSETKREGEKLTLAAYDRSYVIRTSWVFGIANNNFNKQVISWSGDKETLAIVDDQISSPTYSFDLAYYTLELLKTGKYGLYHLSNAGEASKYDQAKYVLDRIGWRGELRRAKSSDFNLPAKRAPYTKLDSTKLETAIGQKLPTWQSGIDRFLEEYSGKKEAAVDTKTNTKSGYQRDDVFTTGDYVSFGWLEENEQRYKNAEIPPSTEGYMEMIRKRMQRLYDLGKISPQKMAAKFPLAWEKIVKKK